MTHPRKVPFLMLRSFLLNQLVMHSRFLNHTRLPPITRPHFFAFQFLQLPVLLFCHVLSIHIQAADSAAVRPNVLMILSDDQGYADAGFQEGQEAVTPHLDALAKSGVRCTNGCVTHPLCSPTRAALLTGICNP